MTTTYVGELTLAVAIPFPAIAVSMSNIQQQLNAMLTFSATLGLPPTPLVAQIQLAQQIVTSLQLALSLGIPPPTISAQLSIVLGVIALLKAQLAAFAVLSAGGVFAYVFDGATNAMGAELTAELAAGFPGHGPATHANVLVLGTVDPSTWAAMQVIFKTTP